MIDENAFGILLSYFAVEDDEYGLERQAFVARFEAFRSTVRNAIADHPLGKGVRALELGHAVYLEVADGDHGESPLAWAKRAKSRLAEDGFEVMAVVTHGGRWIDESAETSTSTEFVGDVSVLTLSFPSEPLRRALYADAASRPSDGDAEDGWGPGLYLDVEAVEALGIKPRNAPTSLPIAGAEFFRVGA